MSTWATAEDVHPVDPTASPWPAAPTGQLLVDLLDAAEEQCREFAPLPVVLIDADGVATEQVGPRHKLAVIYQARELYAAAKRDGDVISGSDSYVIRARPLVASVKQLLRPSSPRKGRIG